MIYAFTVPKHRMSGNDHTVVVRATVVGRRHASIHASFYVLTG
ncbi:MAG: hypothetical protein ACR2JC_13045 [Chloroflexota bacterium]